MKTVRTLVLLGLLAASSAAGTAERALFEFHSDPWVNLHHFLYHAARNGLRGDERLAGRVSTYEEDRAPALSDQERAVMDRVLAVYAQYGDRDLLFDSALDRIKIVASQGPDAFPRGADAEPAYAAMRQAMPIYLEHWWPQHDAYNRARMDELEGYLETYGQAFAEHLLATYESEWPAEPIRVDLSVYSGRHGAYASNDPNHITFATRDDWYPGLLGLEILFHEASHTIPTGGEVVAYSEGFAQAAGVSEGGLWHAFYFYAPMMAARAVLPEDYQPYPIHYGLFIDGRMSRHLPYIERGMREGSSLLDALRIAHQARAEAEGG